MVLVPNKSTLDLRFLVHSATHYYFVRNSDSSPTCHIILTMSDTQRSPSDEWESVWLHVECVSWWCSTTDALFQSKWKHVGPGIPALPAAQQSVHCERECAGLLKTLCRPQWTGLMAWADTLASGAINSLAPFTALWKPTGLDLATRKWTTKRKCYNINNQIWLKMWLQTFQPMTLTEHKTLNNHGTFI